MSDETDLWKVAVTALIDVFMAEGARRKRWIRILNVPGTLLFTVLIAALIYVTVRYS